ncbi:MAG: hypothetical protein KDC61_05075 [Saprospiraceae bacterium]|nr:hypothetical protein [Saprospiraceae bacterium]MCB0544455.1 hypothetical protein [Saprospiraceae bacterium]MCB0573922.1 hypothetical protein [Saprospiraceae bacterium]MCB9306127.1 hypothetical protein [Lewinellaceae bacterium]
MATILKQLTLADAQGTKVLNFVPTAFIARFTADEINTLLLHESSNSEPQGIRFHFEKNTVNATVGLIAVSLGVISIPDGSGGTVLHNRELTSGIKKYLRRGAATADLTATEYQTQFPDQREKLNSPNGITNSCVFFSRTDLQEILGQSGVTGIAFFSTTIERTFTATREIYDSLVAVGTDSGGATLGMQIRSELPCPPHCGDDYP